MQNHRLTNAMRLKINYLLLATFAFISVGSFAQKKILLQKSIYFESAKYDLSKESDSILNSLVDSFKSYKTYKIFIKGNTDNIGDSIYNKKLSEQRVASAIAYFISKGIDSSRFVTSAFGEEKPIAENSSEEGKQKNRRVDISISYVRKVPIDSSKFLPYVASLYKFTEIEPDKYKINALRDTIIRCKKGTLVLIKANTFKVSKACDFEFTFSIKEDFLKSEMILDNLSTTSNGQILETQGMIYTEAKDCKGKALNVKKSQPLTVMMPTDSVNPDAKLFQGNRTGHDSIMNWTVSNSSVLKSFTLKQLNYCADGIGGCLRCYMGGCGCRFFFCRVRRLDNSIMGLFSKCERFQNRVFRKEIQICRLEGGFLTVNQKNRLQKKKDQLAKLYLKYPICYRGAIQAAVNKLPPECKQLKELFDQYGVTNIKDLTYAVNKELMDSFGVTTAQALSDTMSKLNRRNVELSYRNKTLSFDDFQYYIYNSTQLGWSNIDVFAEIPKENLVTMTINLKPQRNTDCKLVFKERRFVIPAETTKTKYTFENMPKGEQVWIISLKYLDGKPYLSMQDATVEQTSYNVDFKVYTLEELKEKLKILDFD